MPTAEADVAVQTLLDAIASPVALTADANLFLCPPLEPDVGHPAKSVFVVATGGPLNSRFCGTSSDWRVSTVQVTVRADRSDYAGGQALARACRDALHCPSSMPTGYTDCQVREPDPFYLSTDESGRHLWALNCVLTRAT